MDTKQVPAVNVRNARPEELDKVALVMKEAYQQYERILSPGVWKAYVSDILDVRSRLADSELIVAELDGQLVGAVTLYSDASHLEGGWPSGWAGIRFLAVHPEKRGLGIAVALMVECIRRSRERGIIAIGLHTTEFMEVAKQMYERMGFVRVPEYDHHPTPRLTIMAYRLDI